MPPTFPLPADTQVTGLGNPPGDMNKVVDALNNSVYQRIFYLDRYGADPTGTALSDTAWTNCYSDASAAVQAHAGSLIVMGAGTYKFSVATVAVTDGRVGLCGQGKAATVLTTTGTTGSLVKINSLSGGDGYASAPCGGFSVYGWAAGAAVNGIEFGDRPNCCLTDVAATGFNNGTASRGFWFHDTTNLSEGAYVVANADQNTINYDFDGPGSFDYSNFFLHLVASTAGGSSAVGLRMVNAMHCVGGMIRLAGNASATTGLTTTVLQVGASGSDTAHMQGTTLIINVECDTSVGTVKDVLIQGASSSAGIVNCSGTMFFQNTSGTFTIGTVTSPAVFTMAGFLRGPTFSGHGTLGFVTTSPSTAGQINLAVYSG